VDDVEHACGETGFHEELSDRRLDFGRIFTSLGETSSEKHEKRMSLQTFSTTVFPAICEK
jgi:hypothetical protein